MTEVSPPVAKIEVTAIVLMISSFNTFRNEVTAFVLMSSSFNTFRKGNELALQKNGSIASRILY